MSRKMLVTGGCGFIGSNLIHYWKDRYPTDYIYNLDNLSYAADLRNLEGVDIGVPFQLPNYEFWMVDVVDSKSVISAIRTIKPDGIIHLAANSHVDNSIKSPRPFIETNTTGTFNLLEAVRTLLDYSKVRFHHISTDEVYGDLELDDPDAFTEDTSYNPSSPYSASKAASDHFVQAYHRTYGLNTVITNCSNNYGPRQHEEKLIPTVIKNAIEHKPIPVYGKGANIRDWLYVLDHCKVIDKVFHHGTSGDTYCVGGDAEKTNIAMVTKICAILDDLSKSSTLVKLPGDSFKTLITFVTDRAGHDTRYAIDARKIKKTLDWKPETSLDIGLELTVQWYLDKFLLNVYS